MLQIIEQIDRQIFLLINGCHTSWLDSVMVLISGKYTWIPLYALLLFFLIIKQKKQAAFSIISVVLLIVLADQLSVHAFKETVQRYRPSHNLEIKNMVHIVANHRGGLYGFVSSHASNVFALAAFFSLFFKKKSVSFALLSWAVLVSYSRIYLGVHYPLDILGGALLGVSLAYLIYKFNRYLGAWFFKRRF